MKNRFLTRIFSVIALLVVSLIAVGCAGNETSPARDKAKEQVNNLLNIDFAETKDNVVLEPVTGNVAIATDEDGKVSEKDLANNTYSEFAGGVVAEYSSSHPEIMDAQWVVTLVRDYQYAEDGTTVVGITKKSVYNLVFVVNRPAEDTQVTITITGSKVYEDEGIEYKYTKSREIVFTVKAKEQLEAVEMSIAEINAYANANWAEFSKNGIVDENGNKVQVVTTGVVTEVLWGDGYTNHSFMISDGEESFYVYAPKGDVVELGDLVQVVCTPTYYYSIIETASGPQVTVLLNGQQVPTAKEYTVDEWYAAYPNGSDFHDCPGQRVAITGVLKHNGTNYILESSETGKKFEVYYKGYTAYEESLIKANLGKLVKMEAAIYDYHSQGYYRLLANVYDYPMEVLTLSGQDALDADASTITKEFTVKEGETISLPTSFPNGSTLSAWTADKEGHINLNTLVCTLGSAKEDVTVTLTATLSNGSYSTTVTVVVKLDYVAPAQKEYEVVTNLELGVPYKYVVNQETIGKVLYFAGSLDAQGKYLTSTEAASDGVDVYLEAAAGGYYMYFLNAGVKTYINMAADGSKLALEAAPSNVWVYNAQYNTLFTTVNAKEYFVGMYSTFETFSRSQTSYLANAGNFAAQFYAEKTGSQGPVTPEVPEGQISLKEAVEIASKQAHNTYTSEKYTVTGTVSDLYNTIYGNMHLIDAEGNDLTIYGLYIEGSKYGDYAGSKPVEGDVITVTGILGTYNGTPQMKNADLVVIPNQPEVPHEHVACPTCGKCTAEDCTGEKCEGHSDSPEVPSDSTTVKVNIADYATANGWANSTMYNTLTMNDKVTVTMSAVAGSGTYPANTGKYYATGSTWRAYQSDTEATIVVEANGLTIVSVKFTYAAQNNGTIVFNGKNVATDEVVTVNATSATFTIGNTGSATNGQARITAIEVVYGAAGSTEPEVPTHEHTACPTCGKCTAEDCTGAAEEKCAGHTETPDTPEVPEGQISLKEAVEIASKQAHNTYTTEKYTVTGTVSDLYNTTYGNMHLIDAEGNDLTIYGLYMNGVRYDAMENKPVEGDVITVTGILGTYNGTPQMKNAELVVSTPEVPSHEHTACPTCGKCTAEDCTGAAEDKCAGHVVEPELPEGQISLKEAVEIASKQAHNTYTTEKYTVTGTVSDLYNTTYGNMHLIDAEGNDLTIYGLYMNGVRYDAMENKPVEGDVITVTGILGTYNGTPQMKNAELVVSTPEVPSHEHTACPTCGKCTAEDCTGEKCEGHTETPDTPEVPSESTTVSVSIADYAAANGWANSTMYNTLTMNDKVTVTMSAVAGSGSYPANTGKYYSTGSTWRAYQSDTEATIVVEANGLTIVSVKFTYAAQNNGSIVFNGKNVATDEVVTVNATSATFTIGNTGSATNGQARVTAIEVVYGAAGSTEPEVPTTCEHEGGQASCKAQAVCTKCGEAYGELADHVWDDRGYSYNEEKHWVDCVICQAAKNNEAAHDFTSGNCVCGKEAPAQPEIPADGKITLAQAVEIASKQAHNTYTSEKYTVTGTVSDLYNTTYGNMHLIDAEGNDLTIYGLYMNGVRYDAMENKPVEGDVITVTGILGTYNGTPQMKNAELVASGSNEPETPEVPTHEHTACPTCGKCTAEDCTGAEDEKCAGHEVAPEEPVVAGGKADLDTFNGGVHSSKYENRQSANGWTATFATVNKGSSDPTSTANPQFGFLGDETVYATTIAGGTDKVGTLVSPVLTGGLSKLTFNYTNLFTDTKFSITLTIKTVDGVEIYSEVIAYDNPDKVKYEVRTYEKELNIQGDFVIEFVNNCPNGVTGNKDRATLWNIEWLGAGEVEPETPEVPTHEHVACAECGKCTAEDCTGAEEEKCAGHPVHEHVACAECGKCTAEDCTGTEEEKCAGHEVAPEETTYVLDCVGNFGSYASAWDSSYKARTITFAQLGVADLAGTLVLSNGNKQTSTITDRPVMASKSSATQYATVSVETGTISSVTFVLAQWTTKKFKTLTIEYTTDGTNWVATNVGVVNGSAVQADAHSPLTATLPEGVVAVRFAFLGSTTSNNQIGLTSVEFTHKA